MENVPKSFGSRIPKIIYPRNFGANNDGADKISKVTKFHTRSHVLCVDTGPLV
eukprot:TRINITY_DN6975_c0_g1_i1.p3 TRINITY_DN6975_c0_g1~~TRINITY_DN6975_c0_g1_i1.p3  ORF type:complete len:53 (+),score=4.29 TRINITY_DN6975_c0_g1_i1:426-584(+)